MESLSERCNIQPDDGENWARMLIGNALLQTETNLAAASLHVFCSKSSSVGSAVEQTCLFLFFVLLCCTRFVFGITLGIIIISCNTTCVRAGL